MMLFERTNLKNKSQTSTQLSLINFKLYVYYSIVQSAKSVTDTLRILDLITISLKLSLTFCTLQYSAKIFAIN